MTENSLIAEQLRHLVDLIKTDLRQAKSEASHETELTRIRLTALEEQTKDFEVRLRALQDSSTQFKVLASLATGGGLLSVISLLRELLK
jgi:hypothetical protein